MNKKSIGICLEGCYTDYKNMTEKKVPDKQLSSLVGLVFKLQNSFNIPIQKVFKHSHFADYKDCPGKYFPWDKFLSLLKKESEPKKEPEAVQWKLDEVRTAYDNGIITSLGWKDKVDQPCPVWAVLTMLNNLHDKLNNK